MCPYLCNFYELDVCYNKDNLLHVVNDEYLVKHNVPPECDEEKGPVLLLVVSNPISR